MITDNTAKWRVGSISTPQVNSGDGLLPVGHVYYSMGSSAPAGSLPLWGQLFSRETYKDLWEWVNLHPEQLLSESAWQTKFNENNGYVPFYSEGTDSTNFRVPNVITLGTEGMDFVVEESKGTTQWYRLWKSGWLEQGGSYVTVSGEMPKRINLPLSYENSEYFVELSPSDLNPTDGALVTGSWNDRTVNSFNAYIAYNGSYVYGIPTVWKTVGYALENPSSERILWCVKAFGNIEESVGSTSLTNIANNITQLNTKVDNWVSGTLDSHATAIAEMQSYFNWDMSETLLFDVYNDSAGWTGNITFSDSYLNYDYLVIEFSSSYAVSGETYTTKPINVKWLKEVWDERKSKGQTNYLLPIEFGYASWHWSLNWSTSTDLLWNRYANTGAYPRRVWGYKLKANGITNKSAIDVTQISDKISSLLTTDNHLRLPSGLEVW